MGASFLSRNRVLAIDLGKCVGWAFGMPGDPLPLFGTWHLANTTLHGPRFASYENELIAALERFKPTLVVMASPLRRTGMQGQQAARQALGLAAFTESECYRARVQLREAHEGTVRKDVLGRGTFPAGAVKNVAVAWCIANGWPVTDDHQADALILWKHSCGVQSRLERF